MRETKAECFIVRRSFLELMKLGSGGGLEWDAVGRLEVEEGREIRPEPDFEVEEEDLARMEGRFLGAVGAFVPVSFFLFTKEQGIEIP
jgi:hypothetical protein